MNYIPRNLETVVGQVTKEYPLVLVTSPRQVSKTIMLQKMMEYTDRSYVSLDDLHKRIVSQNDPGAGVDDIKRISIPRQILQHFLTQRFPLFTFVYWTEEIFDQFFPCTKSHPNQFIDFFRTVLLGIF